MNLVRTTEYFYNFYRSLYLAINFHRTHKNTPLSFVNLPYLIDIYKDTSPKKVLMKSTQSGITEWLIIETIVETYFRGRNVFYVLPTEKIKNQFIDARFDQSVQYTEYYRNIFHDAEYNNKSSKQVGNASIFFAVSNSKSNFTSFPADTLIIDELDECDLENIEMAPERLAFSLEPKEIRVANPTYPGIAIDYEYAKSDKKVWMVKCGHCGHFFTPDFFKNIVMQERDDDYIIIDQDFSFDDDTDVRMMCDKCHKPVDRYSYGTWAAQQKSPISGRQMNQIFTSRKSLRSIVEQFNEALTNEIKMQRFYNGTLGLPYIGIGARVTDELINDCMQEYSLPASCQEPCIIGIDVGKRLNTVIFHLIKNEYNYKMRLVYAGELFFNITNKTIDISELLHLFKRFRIVAGLIDAAPEDRLSRMISQNFPAIWRCRYLSENPKDSIDPNNRIFSTDRTMSMDGVKEQIMLGNMLFPKDIDRISNFRNQLKAPMRVFEEKEASNGKWVWREGNQPDHYYHAVNYANCAKKLLLMMNN